MLKSFDNISPVLDGGAWVAPEAVVIGKVHLGKDVNVWHGAVIRGDVGSIEIGARSNIQDLTMIHVTGGAFDTFIAEDVTIGHRVILHGCTIKARALIGMGAIILDGAIIEEDVLIGAGSIVTPGTVIPAGHLALGSPARVVRALSDEEKAGLLLSAKKYVELARQYYLEES